MNNQLSRRQASAQRIGEAYAASPNVGAVLLAGSVARGNADAFSDIEIDVFWKETPRDDERLAPIAALGLTPLYIAADENEWADGFIIDGVKVDTSQFRIATIERWIEDVTEQADTDVEKHLIIAAIRQGSALHGVEWIENWRQRTDIFPNTLAHALLTEHLQFRPRYLLEMLAARDDALFFHQCLIGVEQRLMASLLAANRLFQAHPYHKWLNWQIENMPIKPENLEQRLRFVLRAEPHAAVEEAHQLIEETFALIERHVPGYNTAEARAVFHEQRHGAEE